jgi:Ca-activated chloride channel family protein
VVERRVRIYTIGFGTEIPAPSSCTAEQLGVGYDSYGWGGGGWGGGGWGGGGGFGGGGFGGGGFGNRRAADVPTLQAVATQTGGTFHNAQDADQLREVFGKLPREFATQTERTEVTWLLALIGAVLAAAALAASIRWSPYP